MGHPRKPPEYYQGLNERLLGAVPPEARRILEVGCGEGCLGAALKDLVPAREVFGLELEEGPAARAAVRLDGVFPLDAEEEDPPLEVGSLDCILYGDVLEHLRDPRAVLARHRRLLGAGGRVIACVPNVGHHSVLAALVRGDFPYTGRGLLDSTHLRFFTLASFYRLLLDAGYAPSVVDTIEEPATPGFLEKAKPLLRHLRVETRGQLGLDAYQYIVQGVPLDGPEDGRGSVPGEEDEAVEPLTFVACISDRAIFEANLHNSPCLAPGSPHELLVYRRCRSAAEGLNEGLARAQHPLVVCAHQDVYLPRGWDRRLARQAALARAKGELGVLGIYGVARGPRGVEPAGRVVDRDRLLWEGKTFPAPVETLDEAVLAVPRGTALRFDARLGFHLYGADLCLQAREQGLLVAALDAPCLHNSLTRRYGKDFLESAALLAARWEARLPVATTCALIDEDWLRSHPRRDRLRRWWREAARGVQRLRSKVRARLGRRKR